jgi:hypothetical protein
VPFDGKKSIKVQLNSPEAMRFTKAGLALLDQFQHKLDDRGQIVGTDTIRIPGGPAFTLYVNPAYNVLMISVPVKEPAVAGFPEVPRIEERKEETRAKKPVIYFQTNYATDSYPTWRSDETMLKGEMVIDEDEQHLEIEVTTETKRKDEPEELDKYTDFLVQTTQRVGEHSSAGEWELVYTREPTFGDYFYFYLWRREVISGHTNIDRFSLPDGTVIETRTQIVNEVLVEEWERKVSSPNPDPPPEGAVGVGAAASYSSTTSGNWVSRSVVSSIDRYAYFTFGATTTETWEASYSDWDHIVPTGYPRPGVRNVSNSWIRELVIVGVRHTLAEGAETSSYTGYPDLWEVESKSGSGTNIAEIDLKIYHYEDEEQEGGESVLYLASWREHDTWPFDPPPDRLVYVVQKNDLYGEHKQFDPVLIWKGNQVATHQTVQDGMPPVPVDLYGRGNFIAAEGDDEQIDERRKED